MAVSDAMLAIFFASLFEYRSTGCASHGSATHVRRKHVRKWCLIRSKLSTVTTAVCSVPTKPSHSLWGGGFHCKLVIFWSARWRALRSADRPLHI